MRAQRIRPATAFIVLLLGVMAVYGQGAHTLQGRVISPGGTQPDNSVKVTLKYNGRNIYEIFSDLSGRFSFAGLSAGTYELVAEGDGVTFETTTVHAEVSAFGSAPQLFTQDIQLRAITRKPLPPTAVVNAFTQNVPPAAQQALERGLKRASEGKADLAISEMQAALNIFPQYFEARLQLGNQFLRLNRLDEAIAELDRAREINPKDDRAYQSFGLILMQKKNYSVAVAVFAEASRLNPSNPMNALMRATALIHQASAVVEKSADATGDRDYLLARAESALAQANELSGGKVKADQLTLAMFYELKKDFGRAADELEDYLRRSPESPNAPRVKAEVKRLREAAHSSKPPPN